MIWQRIPNKPTDLAKKKAPSPSKILTDSVSTPGRGWAGLEKGAGRQLPPPPRGVHRPLSKALNTKSFVFANKKRFKFLKKKTI
jgi:hypothetical protein